MAYLKEACVESYEQAIMAHKNGADLIELCSDLKNDGLTPDFNLVKRLKSELPIPIKIMIRPRKGNFCYSQSELCIIRNQIEACNRLDIKEIVFGAISANRLDIETISLASQWCFDMEMTIHKAIDESENVMGDIALLKSIKAVKSILSSGQKPTAIEGSHSLLAMKKACGLNLNLIAAGKITYLNLQQVHDTLGLAHYHGRNIVELV